MGEESLPQIPHKSRSLRARSVQKRLQTELNKDAPKQRQPRQKSSAMSKYRRKTANAKERERMKQVNDAFDRLRGVIPDQKAMLNEDKSTKVTTLRSAIQYIYSLQQLIEDCVNGSIDPAAYSDEQQEDEGPGQQQQQQSKAHGKPVKQQQKHRKAPARASHGVTKMGQQAGKLPKGREKVAKSSAAPRARTCRVILPLKGGGAPVHQRPDRQPPGELVAATSNKGGLWSGASQTLRGQPAAGSSSLPGGGQQQPPPSLLQMKPVPYLSLFPPSSSSMASSVSPTGSLGGSSVGSSSPSEGSTSPSHCSTSSLSPPPPASAGLSQPWSPSSPPQQQHNQISVHISLVGGEDSYSEHSDSSSSCDALNSPNSLIPSIDQLFKRSFSHELEELARSSSGDQLLVLEDIQQILKEAENFDVCI